MAKTKVVYSEDATTIIFNGDKNNPEVSTGIIKFPGGHVEVSRTSDGSYWAHVAIDTGVIKDSRIDYDYDGYIKHGIVDMPDSDKIQHMAIRVYKEV